MDKIACLHTLCDSSVTSLAVHFFRYHGKTLLLSLAEQMSLTCAVQAAIAEAAFMTGMERYTLLLLHPKFSATPGTHAVHAVAILMREVFKASSDAAAENAAKGFATVNAEWHVLRLSSGCAEAIAHAVLGLCTDHAHTMLMLGFELHCVNCNGFSEPTNI